jgi:hypothetical protein
MNLKVKRTKFLNTIVLAILTWLALTACKPETGRSPLATPGMMEAQSRDGGRPRTVPPPGTPNPTPTPLPDRGVRAEVAQPFALQADSVPAFAAASRLRFYAPATDGKTLVGFARKDEQDNLSVVAVDLASGKMRQLAEMQEQPYEPRVSGRYVVWTTLHELYFYDLETGQSGQLDSGLATRHARISGNVVTWGRNAYAILGYNFDNGKSFTVPMQSNVFGAQIEFSGQWVVYQALVSGPSYAELRAVNIRTQEDIYLGEIFIGTQDSPYVPPLYAIDAPWVAWSRGGQSPSPALYLYNLDTRTAYTVTIPSWGESLSEPSPITINPMYLTMSNRVVIFSGYYQDMGYDIERQVFFSLPTNAPYGFDKLGWSIAGDQLVWVLSSGPYGQEESQLYTAKIIRDK